MCIYIYAPLIVFITHVRIEIKYKIYILLFIIFYIIFKVPTTYVKQWIDCKIYRPSSKQYNMSCTIIKYINNMIYIFFSTDLVIKTKLVTFFFFRQWCVPIQIARIIDDFVMFSCCTVFILLLYVSDTHDNNVIIIIYR